MMKKFRITPRVRAGKGRRSKLVLMALAGAGVAVFIGCGGGSGGGSTATTTLSGKPAMRAYTVSSYQGSVGANKYVIPLLVASSPSSSAFAIFGKHPSRTLDYDSDLQLYSSSATSGNKFVISYFTDSAGKNSAGSISVAETGLTTFTTNFTKYPQTVQLSMNLTGGVMPATGQGSLAFLDASGKNTLTGSINLPKTGVTVNLNMTLDDTSKVGGSIIVQENGLTTTMTNLSGTIADGFTGSIVITPLGYVGTADINLLAGTFSTMLTLPNGLTSSATVAADQSLKISYSDGTSLVGTNSLGATPLGAGTTSSTTGTSTTGTATTGTSTTGTATNGTTGTTTTSTTGGTFTGAGDGTLLYAAPVVIPQTGTWKTTNEVASANQNKQLVGGSAPMQTAVGESGDALYWASPTATPVKLAADPNYQGSCAWSINASGQIVGEGAVGIGFGAALYWASPISKPVELPAFPGSLQNVAQWINSSGAIVGYAATAQASGYVPIYWKNISATPVQLAGSVAASYTMPSFISDKGMIYGNVASNDDFINDSSGGTHAAVWTSPTASPILLIDYPRTANQAGVVVGESAGSASLWSPASYTPSPLLAPSQRGSDGFGINAGGGAWGSYEDQAYSFHTCIWKPSGNPFFLSSLVPSGTTTTWDLDSTFSRAYIYGSPDGNGFLFDDYSLITVAINKATNSQEMVYLAATKHP